MKSPEIHYSHRYTREEIEASFKPCPICKRVVEQHVGGGVYRPFHDFEKHGLNRPASPRMDTEDLLGIPRVLP